MPGAPIPAGDLYEPLIERDFAAVPAAARAFLERADETELWLAITRFAVLAYSPSQHAKRAVMACRAVADLAAGGVPRVDLTLACARYAAASRQPWSEPPLLDPPSVDPSHPSGPAELHAAVAAQDRLRAERWLAARLGEIEAALAPFVRGDALLMFDTARALLPRLGERGRYALFRMPLLEMFSDHPDDDEARPLDELIERVIASEGSVETVRAVFLHDARQSPERQSAAMISDPPAIRDGRSGLLPDPAEGTNFSDSRPEPYELGRDFAQTLIAHAVASRFPVTADREGFLRAVHHNLIAGESYAEWSFA